MKKIALLVLLFFIPQHFVFAKKIDVNYCRSNFNVNQITLGNVDLISFSNNTSMIPEKFDYIDNENTISKFIKDKIGIGKYINLIENGVLKIINYNKAQKEKKVYDYDINFKSDKNKNMEIILSFTGNKSFCGINNYSDGEGLSKYNIISDDYYPSFISAKLNGNKAKIEYFNEVKNYEIDGEKYYFIERKIKIKFYASKGLNSLNITSVQNENDGTVLTVNK